MTHNVLIDGEWRQANETGTFQAVDPKAESTIPEDYPVSSWQDIDDALEAAQEAFTVIQKMPRDQIAKFIESYADLIEENANAICELANKETALPVEPRLASAELPRTTGQLRQAAVAARQSSWCKPTIDTSNNIRSCYAAIGPVAVFGPNNFPLAFGSVSGGDFAAAIAAGNPVIAKANSMHPGTTRLLAEQAHIAAEKNGMPDGTVQLLYRTSHSDGEHLAREPRLGAIGYTGARAAGLKLKAASDSVGKPIYLELSSINPVVILPGAIAERADEIAEEFTTSCTMGAGQFCTNPGLVILIHDDRTQEFIEKIIHRFNEAPIGTMLSESGAQALEKAILTLEHAGGESLCGGVIGGGDGYSFANTLTKVSGDVFLHHTETLQTEAFGNASLLVVVKNPEEAIDVIKSLEGNLTGTIYSNTSGDDDGFYQLIEPHLRMRVGRLINDKMPTGVAVSPAMNHGGPYPATGHPGFTAVGIPASISRFSMLQCFDNVRDSRLPPILQSANPDGVCRLVDGSWTTDPV